MSHKARCPHSNIVEGEHDTSVPPRSYHKGATGSCDFCYKTWKVAQINPLVLVRVSNN